MPHALLIDDDPGTLRALAEWVEASEVRNGEAGFALKPWEESLPIKPTRLENCPDSLTIVSANQLYLPIDELPPLLVARLKRLASFSNPVFFKTQALRFEKYLKTQSGRAFAKKRL